MTSLSQQIGWLNKSGRLSDRLSFSEVIGPLSDIDEEAASQILSDLGASGSKVNNPTSYVLAAASRLRDGGARPGRPDGGARPGRPRLGGEAGPRSGDGFKKKIGYLNNNAQLAERISFDDVAGPLSALGDDAAMQILEDLERRAANVNNPTNYILAAAARADGRGGADTHAVALGNDIDPTGKIGRQVGWLNKHASLQDKVSYSDVVEPLSSLDVSSAMKILKDVEEAGDKIRNPTGYILRAADNALQDEGTQMNEGAEDGPEVAKIARQVGWLNKHVPLTEKLSFDDIVGPLSTLEPAIAMKILKDVEEKSDTIKNPTGYVLKAASNAAGHSGVSSDRRQAGHVLQSTQRPGGTPGFAIDRRQVDPTGKIGRQVGWLNKHAELQQPVSFTDVVEPLSAMDVSEAMKILKDLGERAETIKNPTAYVQKAALNASSWDGPARMHTNSSMAVSRGGSAVRDPSGKIGKKVGWINKSRVLPEPLSFSDVVEPLSALDIEDAIKILNDLEDKADQIQKPTAYVIKAAQNALFSNGRSPAIKRTRQPVSTGTARGNPDDSKQISQKIGQLNKAANWPNRLSYSDVKGPLEQCGVDVALEILDDLEHADDVQDPTDFVLCTARSIIGDEGSGQAKRMRLTSKPLR